MNLRNFTQLILLVSLSIPSLRGAESGSQVVVIYNSEVPESRSVAEHYALRRQVPTNQLIGLALPRSEAISRKDYREKLERPLWEWLTAKKLMVANPPQSGAELKTGVVSRIRQASVRYAVLCYGVPLKILKDPGLAEEAPRQRELIRDEASIDNELCLLPLGEKAVPLYGPLTNPFYRGTNASIFHPTNGLLMVTRLDGPTASIARQLVDRAMEAETNGLWGRGYFDLRSITNAEYVAGEDSIRTAAEVTRQSGFDTIVDVNPATFPATTPLHHVAFYAGWYDEHISGPFTRSADFMPGAIAYHLHSFSALTLRSTNRHWAGALLSRGATVTLGSTEEPYLAGTPDIGVLFGHLLLLGSSFGEAGYACQGSISWQTTLVGDPLYRPFARKHQELHEDLVKRGHGNAEWSHARVLNLNQVRKFPVTELVSYLESEPLLDKSSLLLGKMAEFQEQAGQTNAAIGSWRKAVPLATNAMERLEIKTALANKLFEQKQGAASLKVWLELMQEFPDYFDKAATYRKMLALAREAGDLEALESISKGINQLVPPLK